MTTSPWSSIPGSSSPPTSEGARATMPGPCPGRHRSGDALWAHRFLGLSHHPGRLRHDLQWGWYYGWDAFVTRLDSFGNALLWSTFIGGRTWSDGVLTSSRCRGGDHGLRVDPIRDFPVTPGAFDTSISSNRSGFVIRLAPREMRSSGPPTWAATRRMLRAPSPFSLPARSRSVDNRVAELPHDARSLRHHAGPVAPWDAFVTRLNATGSALIWSTYLGVAGNDWAEDIVSMPPDTRRCAAPRGPRPSRRPAAPWTPPSAVPARPS